MDEKDFRTVVRAARFTPAEWQRVKDQAAAAGKAPATFIREAALGASFRPRRTATDQEAVRELARIGNNLNQLAHIANAGGRVRLADELAELVAQIGAKVADL